VVPEAVWSEVTARVGVDPVQAAIGLAPWLHQVAPVPVPASVEAWDLGPGESAVLAWALEHPGATVILDDLAAWRCARAHALEVTGTLGLVLRAHTRGMVPNPRSVIDQLRSVGMWLSDGVVESALSLLDDAKEPSVKPSGRP
jgi:predicted nucleic acid-binding protein